MEFNDYTDFLRLDYPDITYFTEGQPANRRSMSPNSGDVTQTPEPKSSGGLASVFKSFAGGKSKATTLQSPPPNTYKSNGTSSAQALGHSGPPNLDKFYQQLRAENPIADRVSAAEALKYAVQDYPLEGVRDTRRLVGENGLMRK